VSKVAALCDNDKEMMMEFSRLCVKRLNNHLPLKLVLSPFQHFLDANVLKEIEKDRIIIEYAAAAFDRGTDRTDVNVAVLFEMTKQVDREFIKKLSNPFFSLEVRYDDVAEIRKRRIVSFVNMVFELLRHWQDALPFRAVVKRVYTAESYREVLGEVLNLYNIETRMLNNSITFHGPAGKVKDLFAEKLFAAMGKTAEDITVAYTRKIFADKDCSSIGPLSPRIGRSR
jgi:hypothetical protein